MELLRGRGKSNSDTHEIQLASLHRQIHAGNWVLLTSSSTPLAALVQVIANTDVIWDATGSPSDPNKPSDDQHPLQGAAFAADGRGVALVEQLEQPGGNGLGPLRLDRGRTPEGASRLAHSPARRQHCRDPAGRISHRATTGPCWSRNSGGSEHDGERQRVRAGVAGCGNLPAPVPALQAPFSVLYNLLPVSRGKTVLNEVVGSGDAAAAGQSFPLAKSPVTYLEKGASYASTIAMRVDGQPWKEVASFYGQPGDARIFVTSETRGKTHVSFGDGVNGARLPTSTTILSRPIAPARAPPRQHPASSRSSRNPSRPAIGAQSDRRERRRGSRSARPDPPIRAALGARFGRAVSVFDYEAIAAQAPAWTMCASEPRSRSMSATMRGAVASARSVVLAAGDPNRPVTVTLATPIPVLLLLAILATPGMDADAISAGVKSALTDPETGLFAPTRLRIGQPLFDSQIEAACLSVEGTVAIIADVLDRTLRSRTAARSGKSGVLRAHAKHRVHLHGA